MAKDKKAILEAIFAPSKDVLNARPKLDEKIIDELKINKENLITTFNMLCGNWWDKNIWDTDTSGKRMVTNALSIKRHDPLVLSIMADDVVGFKKYHVSSHDVYKFELCCLCGSEKIITEIYLKGNEKQILIHSENCLSYVLSSGKVELAMRLAKEAKLLGRAEAGPVFLYSFGQIEASKQIEKVFQSEVDSQAKVKPSI